MAAPLAHASAAIVSAPAYAWGNVAGWINFAPARSAVTVTDTALTGYAWSAEDGWINLSPAGGGVTNNGSGALGGWAWDQSAGWVSFAGVTIDGAGTFHGEAVGGTIDGASYVINFDCAQCLVLTKWRQTVAPSVSPSNGSLASIASESSVPSISSAISEVRRRAEPWSGPGLPGGLIAVASASIARGSRQSSALRTEPVQIPFASTTATKQVTDTVALAASATLLIALMLSLGLRRASSR